MYIEKSEWDETEKIYTYEERKKKLTLTQGKIQGTKKKKLRQH